MTLTDLMWLATASYGIHILEEYQLNWRDWARNALKLPAEWSDFYVVNALVVVLGIVASHLAATQPAIALSFPALMLINATFFHVMPFVRMRGRFSPGLMSAVALFYPVGIACYWRALRDGANVADIAISAALGIALMALPVVLLLVKDRSYFRQGG